MLYKKNTSETLDDNLFLNPTCEYRGTPFWAWNNELDKQQLARQIEYFKKMGLGGFHMHTRTGLATEYLSDEYMDMVRFCVDKAKEENMLAWLYDEDRWPSGSAGGIVTKDPRFRGRFMLVTDKILPVVDKQTAYENADTYLLAAFEIYLSEDGTMSDYKMIATDGTDLENIKIAAQEKGAMSRFAYCCVKPFMTWYNGSTYVDTLSKAAIDRFIEVTHEKYKKFVGDEFDKIVPAIFTDEPQFEMKSMLSSAMSTDDAKLPWTYDLDDTFMQTYGSDIKQYIPELIWELPEGKISVNRYRYHDHVAERFAEAFADNIGKWCEDNGISLTGHVMEEPTLTSQTHSTGEAMRSYRSFTIPGMDLLCNLIELSTAKQVGSAVNQFGREAALSELYGVSNWNEDFRTYKFQGDWQAALGISVRVPHLSMLSMNGEAKRDYPASIGYQSPWYTQYSYVEDHFARINTCLTRGKSMVNVCVIHPIESFWLHWGSAKETQIKRDVLEKNFSDITSWLLLSQIDFDFVSEAHLSKIYRESEEPVFTVGEMAYNTVIVPENETLRSTTVKALRSFADKGGRIVFLGKKPEYIDALPDCNNLIDDLYNNGEKVPFARKEVLECLEQDRFVGVYENGNLTDEYISRVRIDNKNKWLFLARGKYPSARGTVKSKNLTVRIKGKFSPVLYDTVTGDIKKIDYIIDGDYTLVDVKLYEYDSLLLRLDDIKELALEDKMKYSLSDDNCVLLDMAKYALDEEDYTQEEEEILRLDNILRTRLGYPLAGGQIKQPWVTGKIPAEHKVRLLFTVYNTIPGQRTWIAMENAQDSSVILNGNSVSVKIDGYYTDECICKVQLPPLEVGKNTIEVIQPFGVATYTEWMYLLGDFGVELKDRIKTIVQRPEMIEFGSVVNQKMPFYGGNIDYYIDIEVDEDCNIQMSLPDYNAAIIKVYVDGEDKGVICYPPYRLKIGGVTKGKHTVRLALFGHRYNAFSAIHRNQPTRVWIDPPQWRTTGNMWTYDYVLDSLGILKKPAIIIEK